MKEKSRQQKVVATVRHMAAGRSSLRPARRSSKIPDQLVAEYHASRYLVSGSHREFALQVDVPSAELLTLYRQNQITCAAFITAWNPYSEPVSDDQNNAANRRLLAEIEHRDLKYLCGKGCGSDPTWPPEKSFLVLGITEADAKQLGRKFRQNAIVWAGVDASPQLLLLR